MTELIRHQLLCGGLMLCCGMAAGLIYQIFTVIHRLWGKSFFAGFLLDILPMVLIGYCSTEFLYYGSWGKIRPQDVVCFFAGFWLWRNVYGKEGYAAPGIRNEPPGTGYQYRTEGAEKEKGKDEGST